MNHVDSGRARRVDPAQFGDREFLRALSSISPEGGVRGPCSVAWIGKEHAAPILAGLDPEAEATPSCLDRRAVVFQDARLLPWLHLLENVTLGLRDKDAATQGRRAWPKLGLEG